MHRILKLDNSFTERDITKEFENEDHNLIKALFSTCHTVKYFDGKFQGDEIDLKMFLFTNATMKES